ncbi:universal stress protein [Variovorax sp. HJSM1_2]|uniref:universal stress protein n=1 Tax=Variovorax sp. HJSM1_2 TaxID=3366263 RepID=UPI003BE02F47
MKILLAVDGSPYTKKMLAYLVTHPELFGQSSQFTAFNAQTALPPRAKAALGSEEVAKYHAEEAEKVLKPVVKFLAQKGIDATSAYKVGSTADVISKAVSTGKFDLVVMGSHGHNALAKLVVGSVTTQVLAKSEVPVLVVR